jgi:hypothetical protein
MKRIVIAIFFTLFSSLAHATVSCSLPFNLQNNTTADATQVMANYNALVTCLGNAASAGVNTDITSLTGLSTPLAPGEGGSNVFIGATSTGSANVQVLAATTPIGFTLTAGYSVVFIAGFTNTGDTTLNVNSTGGVHIKHPTPTGSELLTGGEIVVGQLTQVYYDGTNWQLINVANQLGGFGTATSLSSANTITLANAPNHNIYLGPGAVTTINSFATAGSVDLPTYRITFAGPGGIILTYNATSMILPGAGNITTQPGDTATAQYLGSGNWQITSYNRANGSSVVINTPLCGANGLSIANNTGTPNTNIDMVADKVVMLNSTGVPIADTNVSVTVNTTTGGSGTSTANGMDGTARASNAWTYFWFISNGSATAGLGSASYTAPTLPSGYTYSCLMGAMQTDPTGNFFRINQLGNWARYIITSATNTASFALTPMNIISGTAGSTFSATSPTLVAASVRGNTFCAPHIATHVNVSVNTAQNAGTSANVEVAPSAAYSGANNGPNGTNGMAYPIATGSAAWNVAALIQLESSSIYYAANAAGGAALCQGWKMGKINAN